jgi:hypothetical protein
MNLLNFLILALAYLIGVVIIKRALNRTKNDRVTNDEPRRNINNSHARRTKVVIGKLTGT